MKPGSISLSLFVDVSESQVYTQEISISLCHSLNKTVTPLDNVDSHERIDFSSCLNE